MKAKCFWVKFTLSVLRKFLQSSFYLPHIIFQKYNLKFGWRKCPACVFRLKLFSPADFADTRRSLYFLECPACGFRLKLFSPADFADTRRSLYFLERPTCAFRLKIFSPADFADTRRSLFFSSVPHLQLDLKNRNFVKKLPKNKILFVMNTWVKGH